MFHPQTENQNGNMKIINLEKGRKVRKRSAEVARQMLKIQ